MAKLTDLIETYLRQMFAEQEDLILVIQRSELALKFACAPSQINYVLNTRFNFQRGYIVESRRGEGGFIRIIRLPLEGEDSLHGVITEHCCKPLNQDEAMDIILRLLDEKIIDSSHAAIMMVPVLDDNIPLPVVEMNFFRARILQKMVLEVIKHQSKD